MAAIAVIAAGIALFVGRTRMARLIEIMVRTRFPGMMWVIRNGRSPAQAERMLARAYGAGGIVWAVMGLVILFTPGH